MFKTLFFFLLLFSFSYGDILAQLQNKLKSYSYIEARFVQTTYMKDLQQSEKFEGKVFISKPEKVKILYEKPLRQIYLIEGNSLTIYTPQEKQVIKSTLENQFFIARIFRAFSSNKGLKELFKIELEKERGNTIGLVMKVKGDSQIKKVEMLLSNNLDIKQITVWDKEDNQVEINFYDFVYKKSPQDLYIKIPEGVEIIHY